MRALRQSAWWWTTKNVRTDSRGLHGFQRGPAAKPQLTWPGRGEREGGWEGVPFVFGNSAF